MTNRVVPFLAVLAVAGCKTPATTPTPAPTPAPGQQRTAGGAPQTPDTPGDTAGGGLGGAGGRAGGGAAAAPRPYDRVITREAKTRRGMFAVHRSATACSSRSRGASSARTC